MKKFLIIIVLILLCAGGYIVYNQFFKEEKGIPILTTESDKVVIEEYYFYGNKLNMKGHVNILDNNYKSLKLVFYNGGFIAKDIITSLEGTTLNFKLSEEINNGIIIDDIKTDNYFMFLEAIYDNGEEEDLVKYYVLDNQTNYQETTYYTMSKYNNKIIINSTNEYGTMMLNISENKDPEIYDIVIDPGHGGMDSGACSNGHCEIDFTFDLASSLKTELEKNGLKVKLTRGENDLTKNDIMEAYGIHGRAVVSSEVHAKFLFSIHLNSNPVASVNGVEIYTPSNINYDFAKLLVEKIVSGAETNYSGNKMNKMFNGIYTRSFTESDIADSAQERIEKGETPYDITTNSNYYYMIRETGGFMTGAYVDDRNEEIYNKYYNSNTGTEAYICELGYITSTKDVTNVQTNKDNYINAIVSAIKEGLKI